MKIASKVDVPRSTVQRIINEPPTPQKKKRTGRPGIVVDKEARQALVMHATLNAENRRKPWRQIVQELGIELSYNTIKKMFDIEGYGRYVARKKPYLNAEHKAARLQFALEHRHWTVLDWMNIYWTDECYFRTGANGKVYVTRTQDEEFEDDALVPAFQNKTSIMVWGGFQGSVKSRLVVWQKDDWGSIDAESYIDHILMSVVVPFMERFQPMGAVLMEDGAPAHKSGVAEATRNHFSIKTMNWPANSPDLNPIENIWHIMKARIRKRFPIPSTHEELEAAIREEWSNISMETLENLMATMPLRMHAVIKANGGTTKW